MQLAISPRTLRKWWAAFVIYFQDGLAYRASGLIWVMTDVTTAVTMPLVWSSASGGRSIGGFSGADFVLYYLSMLMMGCFITSHMMWDLANDIKEGNFSTSLLRPIGIYEITFFRNLAWRILRSCIFFPIFLILLFAYRGFLIHSEMHIDGLFLVALIGGHVVSFFFMMMMSAVALFVEEVYSIFELQYVPLLFLSGQLFPVTLMPTWALKLAHILPFYYTTGVPTEILVGRLSGSDAMSAIGGQVFWIVFCLLLGRYLWNRGLRQYSGVGM